MLGVLVSLVLCVDSLCVRFFRVLLEVHFEIRSRAYLRGAENSFHVRCGMFYKDIG